METNQISRKGLLVFLASLFLGFSVKAQSGDFVNVGATGGTGAGVGLAFDAAGNIYVSKYGYSVSKISPAPNNSTITPNFATGFSTSPWQDRPTCIAVDNTNGMLYIGTLNGSVYKVNLATGGTVTSLVLNQGSVVNSVVVDPANGNVWFNTGLGPILKYSSTGTQIGSYTIPNNPAAPTPVMIVLDPAGNAYVTDNNNFKVIKISATGTVNPSFGVTDVRPIGITIDASGNLYVANNTGNTVSKITSTGASTVNWATLPAGSAPQNIVADAAGNIYTYNQGTQTVTKIAPSGTIAVNYSTTGATAYGYGIGIDNNSGTLYVATSSTLGKLGTSVALPTTLLSFTGIRQNSDNLLQWSVSNAVHLKAFQVQRALTDGNFVTIATVNDNNGQDDYRYTDNTVTGNAFYRLALADQDGVISYSKTVFLKGSGTGELKIDQVYPVPASSTLHVSLYTPTATNIVYTITDISGRTVKQETYSPNSTTTQAIQIADLSSGLYILKLTDAEGNTAISKFSKL